MKGLRLRLRPIAEPVLTDDELDVIAHLLIDHIRWAERKQSEGRVSESIIRTRMWAVSALEKVAVVRPRTVAILNDASAPLGETRNTTDDPR